MALVHRLCCSGNRFCELALLIPEREVGTGGDEPALSSLEQ